MEYRSLADESVRFSPRASGGFAPAQKLESALPSERCGLSVVRVRSIGLEEPMSGAVIDVKPRGPRGALERPSEPVCLRLRLELIRLREMAEILGPRSAVVDRTGP